MSNDEVWARCGDCGEELKQGEKQCPKCGSTKKAYRVEFSVGLTIEATKMGTKQKRRGFKRPINETLSRKKRSGDPKLKGLPVKEERAIDRQQDTYDKVIKDAETGEIIVEKHERLSEHK
jgi:hypothetical protein